PTYSKPPRALTPRHPPGLARILLCARARRAFITGVVGISKPNARWGRTNWGVGGFDQVWQIRHSCLVNHTPRVHECARSTESGELPHCTVQNAPVSGGSPDMARPKSFVRTAGTIGTAPAIGPGSCIGSAPGKAPRTFSSPLKRREGTKRETRKRPVTSRLGRGQSRYTRNCEVVRPRQTFGDG